MIRVLLWLTLSLAACPAADDAARDGAPGAVSLAEALRTGTITVEAQAAGTDAVSAVFRSGPGVVVEVPAGTIFQPSDAKPGAGMMTLRTLRTPVPAGGSAEAVLPAAVLANQPPAAGALMPGEPLAKLAGLAGLFDKQPDLPRETAQLAVLVMMGDIRWADWTARLAARGPAPSPAQVARAVDALAFVRLAAPATKPAMLADEDFKRLALRNPWARGKAMVLYGLTVEDAVTGDPSLPPDLGKLLHTAPNDNCAICRQRGAPPELP